MTDTHQTWHRELPDGSTEFGCTGCGTSYRLTRETEMWSQALAAYAQIPGWCWGEDVTEGPALADPHVSQWAQDIGRTDVDGLMRIICNLDRDTVRRFLLDGADTEDGRAAWRQVGALYGFRPPFDVVQPDVPAGGVSGG